MEEDIKELTEPTKEFNEESYYIMKAISDEIDNWFKEYDSSLLQTKINKNE